MKRDNAKHIGKLVYQFLRQEGLETPLYEQRLINSWDKLNPAITSYTKELYIRNQILYVHLTSAVLRQELMMNRETLVRHLNEQIGARVITNIVFR
jgi:predicted nucleic acid-binding Zn ribbon protein